MAEKLLSAVKSFSSLKCEVAEGDKKEMKITISNLQKELQEKDIQRERICKDLVSQIKQAEAAASSYSQDLQYTKSRVDGLEKRLEMAEDERNILEKRVKELQYQQKVSSDLEEKIRSLTDVLTAKDQEIEALMQALDAEEVQMEDLTKKIKELEKDLGGAAQNRDALLQIARSKVDELTRREESLAKSLRKKVAQLNMLGFDGDLSLPTSESSKILEVEPLINKWTIPRTSTTSQVRSLRKANNDQVAIAVDVDPVGTSKLQDEDDEKGRLAHILSSNSITSL